MQRLHATFANIGLPSHWHNTITAPRPDTIEAPSAHLNANIRNRPHPSVPTSANIRA
jgi:hypothetical protein